MAIPKQPFVLAFSLYMLLSIALAFRNSKSFPFGRTISNLRSRSFLMSTSETPAEVSASDSDNVIVENMISVLSRIKTAALSSGRDPERPKVHLGLYLHYHSNFELILVHIQLCAVSKTKPVSDIEQLYKAGQRLFGKEHCTIQSHNFYF